MSSEVKRYDPINSDGTCGMCVEDADYGAYVDYADYATLEAELATVKKVAYGNMELLEENANLRAELERLGPDGWRTHSVNFARAERCPQTIETLQAAWDRDQELIDDQRAEIASLKQTVNQLRQKLSAPKADDPVKAQLLEALEFYARGDHLVLFDADEWDTCSGEPLNWLHDNAGTASVEDGSLAEAAIAAARQEGKV